jgi:hypothetical protein
VNLTDPRKREARGVRRTVAAALAAAVMAAGAPASAAPAPSSPTFESHWQDGKAELNGYRYAVTRYGQRREGTAIMVFVTEPFSEAKRVKVDDPNANPKDTFEALKLNFIRDFQTGIYDYNTMTSLFVRSRDFSPAKISFSSAEWCGHVYEDMIFRPRDIADRYTSYFEDESAERRLDLTVKGTTARGMAEEELWIVLRGLRGDWLKPGERRMMPLLASAFYRRLAHSPMQWSDAVVERSRASEAVTVPAGAFKADLYTVSVRGAQGARDGKFWIEQSYPHRIIRWEWKPAAKQASGSGHHWSPGEALDAGELMGSARLPYWRLHNEGDESYLKELGLTAGPGGAVAPVGKAKPGGHK